MFKMSTNKQLISSNSYYCSSYYIARNSLFRVTHDCDP